MVFGSKGYPVSIQTKRELSIASVGQSEETRTGLAKALMNVDQAVQLLGGTVAVLDEIWGIAIRHQDS